ncbi:MAG: methyltransferase [Nanoarchaeota archaeon]|nr:methyltransferase [Nanoarchaeota archaeon]
MYEPREDSYLLAKHVAKHAFGRVLDVGTGSGIQAVTAAKKKQVKSVLGVDIQKAVIEHCTSKVVGQSRKLRFKQSNLFENVKGKFDTIIFNPPYLPEDVKLKDITLDGGKKGYETLERFFDSVNEHLSPDGIILVLFSSLTNKAKVEGFISNNLLEAEEIGKQNLFMEQLYVYTAKKSDFLKKLEAKGLNNLRRLTKGHRGLIFTGLIGKKKVAVKMQRKDIGATGTVDRESRVLKILNEHKIGPKILFSGKDFFAYEFVEGVFIPEFLEKAGKKDMIRVLRDVFMQCYKLDRLGMNKEEMHHPYKHIVVSKGKQKKATLLDFERCKKTIKPHNVTQFVQYITSGKFGNIVSGKINLDNENLRELAKMYKENIKLKNLNNIFNSIKWSF